MADTVSVAFLAKDTGLSEPTVRRALDRGGVRPVTRGQFPHADALVAIGAHIDPAKVQGHALAGRGNVEAAQFAQLDRREPAGVEDFSTAAATKRDTERLKNEKARLDLDERAGKLVDRASVERVAADIVRRATFHFLALAERATPRVMGKSDPAEVAAILAEEARRSLAELSSLDQLADEVLGLR